MYIYTCTHEVIKYRAYIFTRRVLSLNLANIETIKFAWVVEYTIILGFFNFFLQNGLLKWDGESTILHLFI